MNKDLTMCVPLSYVKPVDSISLISKELVTLQVGNDMLVIETTTGKYIIFHEDDCCEHVYLANGPYELGPPLLMSNTSIIHPPKPEPVNGYSIVDLEWYGYKSDTCQGDCEITGVFLKLKNNKQYRFFRFEWIGDSNGYYRTGVDLYEIVDKKEGSGYSSIRIWGLIDA